MGPSSSSPQWRLLGSMDVMSSSEKVHFISIQPFLKPLFLVLEGMDVVLKIEAEGSGSGKPISKVVIVDSGEIKAT